MSQTFFKNKGITNVLEIKCGQLKLNYIDMLQLKLQMMIQKVGIFESCFDNNKIQLDLNFGAFYYVIDIFKYWRKTTRQPNFVSRMLKLPKHFYNKKIF